MINIWKMYSPLKETVGLVMERKRHVKSMWKQCAQQAVENLPGEWGIQEWKRNKQHEKRQSKCWTYIFKGISKMNKQTKIASGENAICTQNKYEKIVYEAGKRMVEGEIYFRQALLPTTLSVYFLFCHYISTICKTNTEFDGWRFTIITESKTIIHSRVLFKWKVVLPNI